MWDGSAGLLARPRYGANSECSYAAEEMARESAFIGNDFDLILDEETGRVAMVADHCRLTEEDYEEMERLEADDSYDPVAEENHYPADDLPF